jgi:hypothetical protein
VNLNLYHIDFKFDDRKLGPVHKVIKQKAPSPPSALRQASRTFFNERNTFERNDIKTGGLTIRLVWSGKATKEAEA